MHYTKVTLALCSLLPQLYASQVESSEPVERRDTSTVSITDPSGTIALYASSDGNMYITKNNGTDSKLSVGSGAIYGDVDGRVLHYFPETMSTYSVSRLRLATPGSIPLTSQMITLSAVKVNSNTSMIFGLDSQGNSFFPVTCHLENQRTNKVFLVKDGAADLGYLTDPNLQTIIMGDVVDDCSPLALTSSSLTGLSST